MGMYDYVDCLMDLPYVGSGVWQTKSFEDCGLGTYTLTEEGHLLDLDRQPMSEWTGAVEFYDFLPASTGHSWVCYVATVVKGRVTAIIVTELGDSQEPDGLEQVFPPPIN